MRGSIKTMDLPDRAQSEELEMPKVGQTRERINTVQKKSIFGSQSGVNEDAWVFPIGWNRKLDPGTGRALEPADPRFRSNEIQTAKYTPLNFVPYNLLHQLSKGPNIYYLFICLLQMIKPISITGG